MLFVLLFALLVLWYFQGRTSGNHIEYIAIAVAIISALVAMRHFKLSNTFSKVHGMTQNFEASMQIAKVLKFLDNVNPKIPDTFVCKENIENDEALFASVTFILGFLDDLATAVKEVLIEEDLTKELMGGFFVNMTKSFKPYIDEISELRKRQTYENLVLLYSKWKPKNEI